MKLLVVTQYFWPETFRINELVAEYAQKGHQVTVLTGLPNYPDGKVYPEFVQKPSAFAEFEGAKVVRVPLIARGKGGLRLILNYLSFALSASTLGLWKLRGQHFDAILAYEPSPITVGIPAAILRFVKKAPMAFWVLDLWPETLKAIGVVKSEKILEIVAVMVRWIYKRCDLILAQSQSFIGQIGKHAPPNARIEYFPAWADDVFFQDKPAQPAPEIPLSAHYFTVLFAGNMGVAQDFPAILSAAEQLKAREDLRWVIVGDGRMESWVRQEIERRGLQNKVILAGRHPLERMPAFFAHADALLVSLKDEPIFGMTIPGKVQAYFSSGIPLVAMLNGEGAHVIQQAQAGLTGAAGDSQTLAKNVESLMSMTVEHRLQLGENGKQFCQKQFDRTVLMNRLENWLIQLTQQAQGKQP